MGTLEGLFTSVSPDVSLEVTHLLESRSVTVRTCENLRRPTRSAVAPSIDSLADNS